MDGPPSYITFDRLSLKQTFRRVCDIFVDRYDVFLPLSAISMVPFLLIMITTVEVAVSYVMQINEQGDVDIGKHVVGLTIIFAIETIAYLLTTIIGQAGMIRAVAEIYSGRQPNWYACFQRALPHFLSLLGASCLYGLAILLGLLVVLLVRAAVFTFLTKNATVGIFVISILLSCFAAFVLYLSVCMTLFVPAIVIESKSAVAGVRRAFELASSRWCYVFCYVFIFTAGSMLINGVVRRVVGGGDPTHPSAMIMGVIVSYFPQVFLLPCSNILQTVLYFNLRIDKESMNAEILALDMASSALREDERRPPAPSNYREIPLLDDDDRVEAPSQVIPATEVV